MPIREKSACIMAAALFLSGLFYFGGIFSVWSESGEIASPTIPYILIYTSLLVTLAIIGHIIAAVVTPTEADTPLDERERQILTRAGYYSSYAIVTGTAMSLGLYVFTNSGDLLFYTVLASLLVSQLIEYIVQILFYRTSV